MALAVDAVTTLEENSDSSHTASHTCSGADRLLLACIAHRMNGSEFISAITYNSVSMTAVPSSVLNNGIYRVSMYYLIAPDTGSNTFSITYSGGTYLGIGIGLISFAGAHQTVPLGTAVTASGTSSATSVTVSSSSEEIVVDVLNMVHNGTLSVGTGQTARWNDIDPGGFFKYAGSTEQGGASTTMSWSNTTSQAWVQAAVPVKPTAVVSAGNSSNLLLLGAG
jgi:hypothetical protein